MNILYRSQLAFILFTAAITWPGCRNKPVVYPQRKQIIETVYASGRVVPVNEYKLSALSNGTILQKLVHDGDTVKSGQMLYIVSNESAREKYQAALKSYQLASVNMSEQSPLLNDLKLTLENASIRLTNDSVNYFRWKNLWDRGIGTKSNLDNAYSSYQLALNQQKIAAQKYRAAINDTRLSHRNALSLLTQARNDLDEYYISSDHAGVVYQTFKEKGEAVHANEVVALLGEHKQPVIRLAVDQQDIDRVRVGQQVLLQTDATGDKIFEAVVTCIFPVMNETDQTFRVDAELSGVGEQLFIHGSIEANIIIQKKSNALVLPRSVLSEKDSLWTRIKGKDKKTGIKTGITTLDYIEILSGVDEKTPVLIAPKL